jgi:hypothetical protein
MSGPSVPAACGAGGTTSCTLADAPAALLPNGNILFAASAGYAKAPAHFFEFTSANAINQVSDTVDFASSSSSYFYNFLVLPNGQILETDFSNIAEVYTPTAGGNSSWAPVISSLSSTTLAPGGTYQVAGVQLNGLSQGAAYGDDVQGATNYPIVRITTNSTGHVFYAKTSGFSNLSIAPNNASTASFKLPPSIETGASQLVVIANGIPSAPVAVNVGTTPPPSFTLAVSELGPGTVTSSPAGISCGNGGACSASFPTGMTVTLSEIPASGWNFLEWNGACTGVGSCSVTMNANENLMATLWLDAASD